MVVYNSDEQNYKKNRDVIQIEQKIITKMINKY